jgi:hypothetical protein
MKSQVTWDGSGRVETGRAGNGRAGNSWMGRVGWGRVGRDGSGGDKSGLVGDGSVRERSVRDGSVGNLSVAKIVAADPPSFIWLTPSDPNLKKLAMSGKNSERPNELTQIQMSSSFCFKMGTN